MSNATNHDEPTFSTSTGLVGLVYAAAIDAAMAHVTSTGEAATVANEQTGGDVLKFAAGVFGNGANVHILRQRAEDIGTSRNWKSECRQATTKNSNRVASMSVTRHPVTCRHCSKKA